MKKIIILFLFLCACGFAPAAQNSVSAQQTATVGIGNVNSSGSNSALKDKKAPQMQAGLYQNLGGTNEDDNFPQYYDQTQSKWLEITTSNNGTPITKYDFSPDGSGSQRLDLSSMTFTFQDQDFFGGGIVFNMTTATSSQTKVEYTFGNIGLKAFGDSTSPIAGVLYATVLDDSKTKCPFSDSITFKNIEVHNYANGDAAGLAAVIIGNDNNGKPILTPNCAEIKGNITADNIFVTAVNGTAYGVDVGTLNLAAEGANSAKTVKIGNINANGENAAYGVYAGKLNGGTLTVKNVTIESYNEFAMGFVFDGGVDTKTATNAKFETGTINITSYGTSAVGIDIRKNGSSSGSYNAGTNDSIGEIVVNKYGTKSKKDDDTNNTDPYDAAGIRVENDSNFIITNNITVHDDGGKSVGINIFGGSDGSTITLGTSKNNLTISADTAISMFDTTKLESGKENALKITGSKTVTLDGSVLNVTKTEIKGATLAVDGGKIVDKHGTLGTVSFDSSEDGKAEVYGWTLSDRSIATYESLKELSAEEIANYFTDKGTIVEWGLVKDTGKSISSSVVYNIQAKSLKAAAFDGYSAAAVMHNRHTALNAVRDHLLMAVNYDGYQYRAQAPAYNVQPISAQNTSIPPIGSAVRAAWGNYIGRSTKYRSPAGGDWDIISDGFQAGTEIFRAADCQIGTFFGYEGQKAERTAATVDGEDFYFGFYGSHISCDGTDLRAVVNFGFQQFDINRSFNTINGGVDRYQSSVNGNSLELNFEAGKSGWWGPWKLRLAGAVDVYGNRLASAADNHNVRFGGSDYWQTFLRLGADFRYEWDRFVFNGKLYYMYDVCGDQIHADLSGGNLSGTLSAPVPGRSVVQFSAGGAYHLCDTLSLFGSFTGDCATDRGGAFQSTGQAGLAWKW